MTKPRWEVRSVIGSANWWLVPILAVIVLASLAAGMILEIYGLDASKAWEGFAAALGALVGVHVPQPTTS